MKWVVAEWSGHFRYKLAMTALFLFIYGSVVLVTATGLSELWLLPVFPAFACAVIMTFRRLRLVGKSGWWVVLMIVIFDFGPEWYGLHLVGVLMDLSPVWIAWHSPETPNNSEPVG